MAIPKSRELTQDETREILSLERNDITLPLLRSLFGCFLGQTKPRFNTYDKLTLPAKRLYNDTLIKTTIGRFILNLTIFPEVYLKKYGYQNIPLDKKSLEKIESNMGDMILNGEMTTKEYADYLDYGEWIGMGTVEFLGPTMDYDINAPIKEVIEKRDELFEKYSTEIKHGDSAIAEKIEKEVLDLAKSKIKEKGNEAYDFFESGIGSFANNYKKTSIMAGAIENPYTKKLDILKSNYMDGVKINEYGKFSNLTLIGGYSRGVATQVSGYQRKKLDNAVQNIVLDDDGSDCGTKYTLNFVIPDGLESLFLNRYIEENGKLVLLTQDNIKNYSGKMIHLRSPLFCKSKHICSKCAGELFYKMGVKNAGLLTSSLTGTLLNLSMKKFHDATIKFTKIDIENYIREVK